MRVVDLIEKKREKEELTKEEICFLLNEYLIRKCSRLSDVGIFNGSLF